MTATDYRGCEVSGATPAALEAFETALAAFQSWRSGAEQPLVAALLDAPQFVMAHLLQAYLHVGGRDPARIAAARPLIARTSLLAANARERAHVAAISALIADDYNRAKALLGEVLRAHPRDVVALQVVHALDYVTGDVARMADRVPAVLPAWSRDVPGFHAVLAMHAFGLEESGDHGRAERFARAAIGMNAFDARAHHVLAHVFEMTDRPDAGVRWMEEHVAYWAGDTVVATHGWWHVALFHLARGDVDRALALYDARVRADRSHAIGDMIDASALLWRIELQGGDAGARWAEIASAWLPHIGDGFCTFSDLHAMMAFVGARNWGAAHRLHDELEHRQGASTRHGATTRSVGLPASRALIAFGRGDDVEAISLLAGLPAIAHRIGGSQAQRDLLHLTLMQAVANLGRPKRPLRIAA